MAKKNLFKNKEFLKAVSEDREIQKLLHTPEVGVDGLQMETLICLGDTVQIAGQTFPAPTLGTMAALSAMDHPLIVGTADGLSAPDVLEALFLLRHRENAIPLFQQLKLGLLSEEEWMDRLFAEEMISEDFDFENAAGDLMEAFSVSGGYAAIPRNESPEKPARDAEPHVETESSGADSRTGFAFDADYVNSLTALICSAFPAVTPFEVTWRTAYPQTGYMALQAMRRNGTPGLGTRMKTDEAWQRFKSLQQQFAD